MVGGFYAATLVLVVLANKLTTSANAIFLQSTAPLYLLLLGPLVLKERIRGLDLALMAAVGAGIYLLVVGGNSALTTAPDPMRGNLFGALSGAVWAMTLTGLRWLGKHNQNAHASGSTVIVGNVIAFAVCAPFGIPIAHVGATDTMILLYLGVFQIGMAYIALTKSITHVPALEASTLLLVEPVCNPIWTWLVHGEHPSALALAGGVLVIAASLTGTWWRTKAATRSA